MPRPRRSNPWRHLHTTLPEELMGQVELLLYSPAEQRVPRGAWQELVLRLLREFVEHKSLDLSPYFHDLPPGSVVRGPEAVVDILKEALEAK